MALGEGGRSRNPQPFIGVGARVVPTEMGDNEPIETSWKTEWAMESLVALLEKYGIQEGSFDRWVNAQNTQDSDPTIADPVNRRGVQNEILDWAGFHLTAIPNGSFEDDLDSNGIPTHWALSGKGSASAYYLPPENGQPQVPSR